jgi:hypothetical protein
MAEFGGKETHMIMMEFPHVIDHMAHRCLENKKSTRQRKKPTLDGET